MPPLRLLPLLVLVVPLALAARGAAADPRPPSGAEWRRYCDAYVAELGGAGKAGKSDDLDVTYCVGLTAGVLAGLRLGSQLGALGMASRLAVGYRLDTKEVFEEFKKQTPEKLLQVCPPASLGLHDYISTVHGYVKQHPETAQRPLPELFFAALQIAYPCEAPAAKP